MSGKVKSHIALRSELQTGGARSVRQRANAPVIEVAAPVEDDLVDSFGQQKRRDGLAHLLCSVELGGVGRRTPNVARESRRVRHRLARHVVDDLSVDVPRAPENAETRPLRGPADLLADAQL